MVCKVARVPVLGLFVLTFAVVHAAEAAPKFSPKALQKAGARLSVCPTYVGHLKSGLYSSMSPGAVCGSFGKVKSKKFKPTKAPFALSSSSPKGSVFQPVSSQEGDTRTELFSIGNYPALISYQVEDGGTFIIDLLDSTGKKVSSIADVRGASSNVVAINTPGVFSLRASGAPEGKDGQQPSYTISMSFMDPYEGSPVSMRDLADASIKPVPCPKSILASSAEGMVDIPSGTVCSKKDMGDAGMTAASFNLVSGLFLAPSINVEGTEATTTLPFRVGAPTRVSYEVSDPSPNGTGGFKVLLVNLETGKETPFISSRGSVGSGESTINVTGDYYLRIETRPTSPKKNGPLSYAVAIE